MKRLSILMFTLLMLLSVPAMVGAYANVVANPLDQGLEGRVPVEVKVKSYAEIGMFTNIWVDEFSEPGIKSNEHWFGIWTNTPVKVTAKALLKEDPFNYNDYFSVTLSDTKGIHGSTEYEFTFSAPGFHTGKAWVITEWLKEGSNWWEVEPNKNLTIGALVYTVQAL